VRLDNQPLAVGLPKSQRRPPVHIEALAAVSVPVTWLRLWAKATSLPPMISSSWFSKPIVSSNDANHSFDGLVPSRKLHCYLVAFKIEMVEDARGQLVATRRLLQGFGVGDPRACKQLN
jgi:hypothetical protein